MTKVKVCLFALLLATTVWSGNGGDPACQWRPQNRWYGHIHRFSASVKDIPCPATTRIGYLLVERYVPDCWHLTNNRCGVLRVEFKRMVITKQSSIYYCIPGRCKALSYSELEGRDERVIIDFFKYSAMGDHAYVADRVFLLRDDVPWPISEY